LEKSNAEFTVLIHEITIVITSGTIPITSNNAVNFDLMLLNFVHSLHFFVKNFFAVILKFPVMFQKYSKKV